MQRVDILSRVRSASAHGHNVSSVKGFVKVLTVDGKAVLCCTTVQP